MFRVLRPELRDAFVEAGRGWGNTITNDFAILRIDQVWVGDESQPRDAIAYKTRHPGRRMVIRDLVLLGK